MRDMLTFGWPSVGITQRERGGFFKTKEGGQHINAEDAEGLRTRSFDHRTIGLW